MSSTGSVGGVQETRAQAYARALEVWGQWLRQWRRTGTPRALHATLACKQIASERFAAWRAELRADRSARQSMRAARTELVLEWFKSGATRRRSSWRVASQRTTWPGYSPTIRRCRPAAVVRGRHSLTDDTTEMLIRRVPEERR
jgi:hypothetical protein